MKTVARIAAETAPLDPDSLGEVTSIILDEPLSLSQLDTFISGCRKIANLSKVAKSLRNVPKEERAGLIQMCASISVPPDDKELCDKIIATMSLFSQDERSDDLLKTVVQILTKVDMVPPFPIFLATIRKEVRSWVISSFAKDALAM